MTEENKGLTYAEFRDYYYVNSCYPIFYSLKNNTLRRVNSPEGLLSVFTTLTQL
jgi:hypothetical protein